MELSCWLAVTLVCLSAGSLCRAESSGMGMGPMECSEMVTVDVEEPIVNREVCLTVTGTLMPAMVNISVSVGRDGIPSLPVYTAVNKRKCVHLNLSTDQTVAALEFIITAVDFCCIHKESVRVVPDPVTTEFIIAISVICALILVLIIFICCLSCILCFLLKRDKASKHKKPQMVKWADTKQGNVELLQMKTLSETILENGPSDTVTVEEGKKESVDGRKKEELGALTANTFGFQGEIVKNEEKPTTLDVTMASMETPDKQPATGETVYNKQSAPSEPSDSAPPTSAPSSSPTPSIPVTSTDKPSPAADKPPTSGGVEAKPSSSTDTNPAADSHVSTNESSKLASDIGKPVTVTSPKVTFSNDIEKILGVDLKLETPGTAL